MIYDYFIEKLKAKSGIKTHLLLLPTNEVIDKSEQKFRIGFFHHRSVAGYLITSIQLQYTVFSVFGCFVGHVNLRAYMVHI